MCSVTVTMLTHDNVNEKEPKHRPSTMLKTSRIFRNFLTSMSRVHELAAQSPVGDGSGRDYHRASTF